MYWFKVYINMMNSDRSMFDTYRSYSLTRPNSEAVETLQRSYNTLSSAFWYYPMKIYYYFFPPKITCGEDDYKSIADYLFIKFGMTYHINQKPLTPVSSYGTLEDGIEEKDENEEKENSIMRTIRMFYEDDSEEEFNQYIHEKYSRSVSSPY